MEFKTLINTFIIIFSVIIVFRFTKQRIPEGILTKRGNAKRKLMIHWIQLIFYSTFILPMTLLNQYFIDIYFKVAPITY